MMAVEKDIWRVTLKVLSENIFDIFIDNPAIFFTWFYREKFLMHSNV